MGYDSYYQVGLEKIPDNIQTQKDFNLLLGKFRVAFLLTFEGSWRSLPGRVTRIMDTPSRFQQFANKFPECSFLVAILTWDFSICTIQRFQGVETTILYQISYDGMKIPKTKLTFSTGLKPEETWIDNNITYAFNPGFKKHLDSYDNEVIFKDRVFKVKTFKYTPFEDFTEDELLAFYRQNGGRGLTNSVEIYEWLVSEDEKIADGSDDR